MPKHRITLVRLRPQTFQPECTCGWVGLGKRSGTPLWSKAAAAGRALEHQREMGMESSLADLGYEDRDPRSRRRKT